MPRPSFPTTVQQFTALFSTEEACESYLERCRWPDGFVCVRCDSLHGWRIVRAVRSRARSAPPGTTLRRVVWECADCHEQVSLTSGTILDSTKLPLTIWFLAAFFAVTDKRGLSATLLARHLGLGSYKTAWFLLHKLRRAMVNANRTKLRGRIEIDGTWVGGYQPGLKGGRQLKGRKAAMVLVAAETVTVQEKTRAVRIRAEVVYNENALSVADFITRLIESGSVIVSDGLHPYTDVTRELGYAHERRVQGDLRKPGAVGVVPVVHNTIRNLKGWLNGTHHGVGRPHLQAYLDEFVFRHNRRGNLEAAFQTLLGLGSKHAPVRTKTILGAQDLPYFQYPDENPQPVLEG